MASLFRRGLRALGFGNKDPCTVLLIGETGSGKSTLINYLTNFFLDGSLDDPRIAIPTKYYSVTERFSHKEENVKDQRKSQTQSCNQYEFQLSEQSFIFIDTPGLSDTRGHKQDDANVDKICAAAANAKKLSAIVIVINGTMSRATVNLQNTLTRLRGSIPDTLLKNLVVVLTNCTESDYNFNFATLKPLKIDKVKNVFHMNNSALSRDPEEWQDSDRQIAMMDQQWEISMEETAGFIDRISGMGAIGTEAFVKMRESRDTIKAKLHEALLEMKKLQQMQDQLEKAQLAEESLVADVDKYSNYKQTEEVEYCVLVDAEYHSTICLTHTDVVCHERCGLAYTPDNTGTTFSGCACMAGSSECSVCGCEHAQHYHAMKKLSKEKKTVEKVMEDVKLQFEDSNVKLGDMKKKINSLTSDLSSLKNALKVIEDEIKRYCIELKKICKHYNFVAELHAVIGTMEATLSTLTSLEARAQAEGMIREIKQLVNNLSENKDEKDDQDSDDEDAEKRTGRRRTGRFEVRSNGRVPVSNNSLKGRRKRVETDQEQSPPQRQRQLQQQVPQRQEQQQVPLRSMDTNAAAAPAVSIENTDKVAPNDLWSETPTKNKILIITFTQPKDGLVVENVKELTDCVQHDGNVDRISIQSHSSGFRAMVQFDSIEAAGRAKTELAGTVIAGFTYRIGYAKATSLKVLKNTETTWDYTRAIATADKDRNHGDAPVKAQLQQPQSAELSQPQHSTLNERNLESLRNRENHNRQWRDNSMNSYTHQIPSQQFPSQETGHYRTPHYDSSQFLSSNHNVSSPSTSRTETDHGYTEHAILVSGLHENFSCDRIFNLFCLYGNVTKVEFLSRHGGSALVYFESEAWLTGAVQLLDGTKVLGWHIGLRSTMETTSGENTPKFTMNDGGPSFVDYRRSHKNRFGIHGHTAEIPVPPTSRLLFAGAPAHLTEPQIAEIFRRNNCKGVADKILVYRSSDRRTVSGVIEWKSVEEAVEAVVMANNAEVTSANNSFAPYVLKLSFDAEHPKIPSNSFTSGYGRSDQQPGNAYRPDNQELNGSARYARNYQPRHGFGDTNQEPTGYSGFRRNSQPSAGFTGYGRPRDPRYQ